MTNLPPINIISTAWNVTWDFQFVIHCILCQHKVIIINDIFFTEMSHLIIHIFFFGHVLAVQTDPIVATEDIPAKPKDPHAEQYQEDNEDETEERSSWYEDDPTWNPEKIDSDYQQIKDEDDSEKTHDNPRY